MKTARRATAPDNEFPISSFCEYDIAIRSRIVGLGEKEAKEKTIS